MGSIFIEKAGTGLTDLTVDDHGAGAADFLQTIRVVSNGGRVITSGSLRVGGNALQSGDDILAGLNRDGELLPA